VLVGTMNLCPCGARGDPGAECRCSPQRLSAYREKVSRALLDRFDLVVQVPRAPAREFERGRGEASVDVRARVETAAGRLADRRPRFRPASEELLARAVDSLPLSARGRSRVRRVARTIAALAGEPEVSPSHLAEALSYRTPSELAVAA
jgi:magnesium chelatase family protein